MFHPVFSTVEHLVTCGVIVVQACPRLALTSIFVLSEVKIQKDIQGSLSSRLFSPVGYADGFQFSVNAGLSASSSKLTTCL